MNFLAAMVMIFSLNSFANPSPYLIKATGSFKRNLKNAKELLYLISEEIPYTLYCRCKYTEKSIDFASCGYQVKELPERAKRAEMEHIVPAATFGSSFPEWTVGSKRCIGRKGRGFHGRKCAQTNSEYLTMETDLNNLWPVVGEINALRADYPMADHLPIGAQFGQCGAKIDGFRFEPMDLAKGRVARAYYYMAYTYPGRFRLTQEELTMFSKWDLEHPVDQEECGRAVLIMLLQGTSNSILSSRCKIRFGNSLEETLLHVRDKLDTTPIELD